SFLLLCPPPLRPTLFPYTTLFRSNATNARLGMLQHTAIEAGVGTGNFGGVNCITIEGERLHARATDHCVGVTGCRHVMQRGEQRSEEHTSELQSQSNLVCRLLLEK